MADFSNLEPSGFRDELDKLATIEHVGIVASGLAPAENFERMFVPAAALRGISGTVAEGVYNRWVGLDVNGDDAILVTNQFYVPADWTSMDVKIHWANPTTGTGNVRWTGRIEQAGAGDALNMPGSTVTAAYAVGAQGIKLETTVMSAMPIAADEGICLNIIRGSTSDTFGTGTAVLVLGLSVEKAS